MRVLIQLFSLIFVLLLSACSLLSPSQVNPPKQFVIDSQPAVTHSSNSTAKTLLVQQTQTAAPYNTTQMVYMTRAHQIAYFSKNQWAAMPSDMLTPLITQSIRKSGLFRAVVTPPFTGNTNYILATQLLTFQQEFLTTTSVFHVVFAAQLIDSLTNKIIASQQWEMRIPAPANNPEGGALAANKAVSMVVAQLEKFLKNAFQ